METKPLPREAEGMVKPRSGKTVLREEKGQEAEEEEWEGRGHRF